MGGFLGIGNSSAKTDRKETLKGYGELGNVFNFALPTAEAGVSLGQDLIGNAANYWSKLTSGNRPALQAAVAPEVNQANAYTDAIKRQTATTGTARGGGTAGTNRELDTAKMAEIDNLLFGAQTKGAEQEGRLGSVETSEALNALGIAGNASANLTEISANSRKTSIAANSAIQAQIGGLIEGALMGVAA
jgi:hypothetical protein